jgi:CDP-paratose 2-epimerase
MKVLITGGCGFIGSNLAIFLKKKNYQVLSIDNLFRRGSKLNEKILKKNKVKNIKANINRINRLKLDKFDIVIDCCAEPSVEASRKDLDRVMSTNFLGTFNLLKKCIKDKSHLIFLSTSRVYSIQSLKKFFKNDILTNKINLKKEIDLNFSTQSPRSIYGFTKLASEELIKELSYLFNFKYIINRLGVIAGPRQMGKVDQGFVSLWTWKYLNKLPLKYIGFGGNGYQVRDILHVNDLNELIYRQIKSINKINNITFTAGGGNSNLISLKELSKICESLTGNKVKFIKEKKTSSYDIPYFCTSNSFVSKVYKWKPKKTILKIVEDTLNWQKENYRLIKSYLN